VADPRRDAWAGSAARLDRETAWWREGQKCPPSSPYPSPGLGSGSAHFDKGELVSVDRHLLKEILKSQRPDFPSFFKVLCGNQVSVHLQYNWGVYQVTCVSVT